MSLFSSKQKILVIRLHRLGHLPPAMYATQILSEKGHKVLVVEYGNAHESKSHIHGAIPRIRISTPLARFFPRVLRPFVFIADAVRKLSRQFKKEGLPKVLIAHGLQEQIIAYILHRRHGIPFIVHVHEIFNPEDLSRLNRLFLSLEGRILRSAKFLIFPDKIRAQLYRERYGLLCPIYVVYNCTRQREKDEPIDLTKRFNCPANAKFVLYMGGIAPSNAVETAIQAIATLDAVYLLLAGWIHPDYKKQLERLAKSLSVESRVLFLGNIDEEKWGILESVDVCYCVYVPDTLRRRYQATASNKFMEALAAGVPVITNSEKDFYELVHGHQVGVCAKHNTPEDISRALQDILFNPELHDRQSRNGRLLHEREFNYEHQFRPVLKHLSLS